MVKNLDDRLQQYVRWQETVAALGQIALASSNLQDLMDQTVCRLAETLQIEYVELLELQPEGQTLVLRAGYGWAGGSIGRVKVGGGANSQAGFTLLANEPVVVTDLRQEKRFHAPSLLLDHQVISGMTVAISGRTRPYGVLGVHATSLRTFGPDDIHFLRTISNLLASAIRGYEADQAQRDAAARVGAIVNTLVDGVITIDERGTIESINLSAEKIFGYASDEVIGRNVNVLMPAPYHLEHDQYLRNYLQTGRKRIIGIGREVSGMRKDGTIFPMDLAVGELQISGKRMFTGVVRDITDRRRMEREILESAADEQRRIGQDLHDGLCQHLAGIAFATEVVSQKLTARSAPEAGGIEKIGEMIDQAITQARDLARGLQPVTLDANGLVDALKALAGRVEQMYHVPCLLVCDGPCLVYDNNVATHLFRIAQESISNAIKHGKARTLVIELAITGEDLLLTINDDGVGLKNTRADVMGMGLRSMDYRARLIGGTLRILPGEKGGTTIICSVRNKDIYGEERKGRSNGKEKSSNARRKEKNTGRR